MKLERQDYIDLIDCLKNAYRRSEDIVVKGDYSSCLLEDMIKITNLTWKLYLCAYERNKELEQKDKAA